MTDLFGKEPLRTYDTAEPILAHRWWTINEGPALGSWSKSWPINGLKAACLQGNCYGTHLPDEVPTTRPHDGGYGHGCGIYAFRNAKHGALCPPSLFYNVYGQVLLAGSVVQHEHGYRAQKAKIAGIYRNPPTFNTRGWISPELLGRIANRYDVPLLDYHD